MRVPPRPICSQRESDAATTEALAADSSMRPLKLISDEGFCLLPRAVDAESVQLLRERCRESLAATGEGRNTRSSRGHVYAARNVIEAVPEALVVWRQGPIFETLRQVLGEHFGLVRGLFFDKPPDRTWALSWHKDKSIAVADNTLASTHFSRPTRKAGVPHVIASDDVLRRMLTMRIHLDDVTEENGPLRVIPESHKSATCRGRGVEAAGPRIRRRCTCDASPDRFVAARHSASSPNPAPRVCCRRTIARWLPLVSFHPW